MDPISGQMLSQKIPDEFQAELNSIAVSHQCRKGTILFMDGERAENLYFIQSGKVKITKTTIEGKELTLYICQPGELIGELALFQPEVTFTTTAEMMEDGQVGAIPRLRLEELLSQNSKLAVEFMKWMGIAYRRNQSKFRDLMLHGKPGALYTTLIRMTNSYGKQVENGILIDLFLTNKDLASFIGSTRENINRMLNDLRKKKIISIDNGYITVHNINFLREAVKCDLCSDDICRI